MSTEIIDVVVKDSDEIRIRSVNPKLIRELNNIASHLGITINQMLKPVIREWAESKPKHWRETNMKKDDTIEVGKMIQELREISDYTGVPMRELLHPVLKQHQKKDS